MPSFRDAFGSYIKGDDLKGRQVKAMIERVGYEDIKSDSGKDKKLVARFVGKEKGLVLNLTNSETLARLTGTENYDDWTGTTVILYYDPSVKFGAETKGGIRLKGAGGVTAPAAPQARQQGVDPRHTYAPPPPPADPYVNLPPPRTPVAPFTVEEREPGEDDDVSADDIPF